MVIRKISTVELTIMNLLPRMADLITKWFTRMPFKHFDEPEIQQNRSESHDRKQLGSAQFKEIFLFK